MDGHGDFQAFESCKDLEDLVHHPMDNQPFLKWMAIRFQAGDFCFDEVFQGLPISFLQS